MKKGLKGPVKAFRGKSWQLTVLALFIFSGVFSQVDTTRIRQDIKAYGYNYRNLAIDSSLRIPRDTFPLRQADTGSVAIINNTIYGWTQKSGILKWEAVASIGGIDSLHIYTASAPDPDSIYAYSNGDSTLVGYIPKVTTVDEADVAVDNSSRQTLTGTTLQETLNSADTLFLNARSTGIRYGGALSDQGSGVIRITAGQGGILDNSTPSAPTYNSVTWVQTDLNLSGSPGINYIYVNSSGTVTSTTTAPSHTEYRQSIWLHRVSITAGGLYSASTPIPQPLQQYGPQINDIFRALGSVKRDLILTAASTNLSVEIGAGQVYQAGANFYTDATNPHEVEYAAKSPATIRLLRQDGTSSADTGFLNPAVYDNAGVLTLIPGASTRAQIWTVKMFAGSGGNVRIFYGQNFYTTVDDARTALFDGSYTPVIPSNFDDAITLGWIITQSGATDLSDGIQEFITANKFGLVGGAIANVGSGFLTAVTTDATLTGNGSGGSPLGIDLTNANTWTGQQTFNTSAPIFGTMTEGSVLFAGSGGLLSQNNSNFFWDNSNKRFRIGGAGSSTAKLQVNTDAFSGPPYANFGPLLSNSIYFNIHTSDTVTAANLSSLPLRGMQMNRNIVMEENDLTISDREGSFLGLVFRLKDSVRLNPVGSDLIYANRTSINFNKYGGFSSRSAVQSGTIAFDFSGAQLNMIANSGSSGSNNFRLHGYYASSINYLLTTNASDTIEWYAGSVSTGANSAKLLKGANFYGGGLQNCDTCWGVYVDAKGTGGGVKYNWMNNALGLGPDRQVPDAMIDVNGFGHFRDTSRLDERFSYNSNIHSTYTDYSLIDKAYLDSIVAGLGGGGITGSLTAGRVTLSAGTLSVEDDADLTYNTSTNAMTFGSGGSLNFSNSASYLSPQYKLGSFNTGLTLIGNDETHMVSNNTGVAKFKYATAKVLQLKSDVSLAWGSGLTNAGTDTRISRASAGVVKITDDGGTLANGGIQTGSLELHKTEPGVIGNPVLVKKNDSAVGYVPAQNFVQQYYGKSTSVGGSAVTLITFSTSTDSAYTIEIDFQGSDQSVDGTVWKVVRAIVVNNSGTVTIESETTDQDHNGGTPPTHSVDVAVSGTDILIQVTGDGLGVTQRWVAYAIIKPFQYK